VRQVVVVPEEHKLRLKGGNHVLNTFTHSITKKEEKEKKIKAKLKNACHMLHITNHMGMNLIVFV